MSGDVPKMTMMAKLGHKMDFPGADYVQMSFYPDYGDGRNAEWASATPAMTLQANVRKEVADKHPVGTSYKLLFCPQGEDSSE